MGTPRVVTSCGLELLGEFPARADGDVRGHVCPECQRPGGARMLASVPVAVLEASAAVVDLYERRGNTGDPELDGALAVLAHEVAHADVTDDRTFGEVEWRPSRRGTVPAP